MLLTRFSAVLSPRAEPAKADWLRYRLGFFYDACYASVTRQRGADFGWLVLVDDRCPDDFREEVEELAEGAFTPVWTHEPFRRDSFAGSVADLTGRTAERTNEPGHAPYLITTRIDSDDAMAVDFMAAVQAQFERQERLFVNFTRGLQVDRTGAVYRSDVLSNPFISLIERRDPAHPPDTVYVAKHARVRAAGPVREVRAPVMWAQVVHDANLSNIVTGTRMSPRVVADRFDIDLGYDADISGTRLLAAKARHRGRLTRLWAQHPGELTKHAEARVWRMVGTHERVQDDGATLTDRVQRAERDVQTAWEGSRARKVARTGLHAARAADWRMRALANRTAPAGLRVVAGDLASRAAISTTDRIALIAEHSRARRVRPSALHLAAALSRAGYVGVVIAARDPWVRLQAPDVPDGVVVLRRANLGYDFGSWAAVLAAYPGLARAEHVILTNDSILGPFGPVDDLLERIETCGTDVWGATRSLQIRPHLQSFFLAFNHGVLARPPLAGFFAGIAHLRSKRDVVLSYEIGLSRLLDDHDLTTTAGWTSSTLSTPGHLDPSAVGWRELMDAGFPFVKRMLSTERRLADLRVRDYVEHRYGVTIEG